MSNRRNTADGDGQHPPARRTRAVAPNEPPPAQPPEPTGAALPTGTPASAALTMASIRISRGNPTCEETAAVAALLMASLRRLHGTGPSPTGPRVLKLPHRPRPTYRAPNSWAS